VSGLYIHIPFCESKCSYCDFYSVIIGDEVAIYSYLNALKIELTTLPSEFHPDTVYIGGGTPTSLSTVAIEELVAVIGTTLDAATAREWTVEINPGTLTCRKADVLKAGGVNRISMGVQSFDENSLTLLGRRHSVADVRSSYQILRDAGIENLSLDIMYGLPGGGIESVDRDIDSSLELMPKHISAYCLSYEEGTPLFRRRQSGALKVLDDELVRDQYDLIRQRLCTAGYRHYEISNFAKPGFECRHNMLYWSGGEYIGCGPAAHSHWGGVRFSNIPDVRKYSELLLAGISSHEMEERLSFEKKSRETLIMSLRCVNGIDMTKFKNAVGVDPLELCGEEIHDLVAAGLLLIENNRLRLSDDALFISDSVFRELV